LEQLLGVTLASNLQDYTTNLDFIRATFKATLYNSFSLFLDKNTSFKNMCAH